MPNALRALPAALVIPGLIALAGSTPAARGDDGVRAWPAGTRAALSLSFDDARASQIEVGIPLLAELRLPATFYLTASNIGARGGAWRAASTAGHEIGNHTMSHPCTGHFDWSRNRALEEYTAARIEAELVDANRAIASATGVTPVTFAYPCGQTFYGRGAAATSYIPLVARLFVAGRGFGDETPNDLGVIDLSRVLGVSSDEKSFEELKPLVDKAVESGQWLVLAGHDIGATPGAQVTRVETLRALAAYAKEPSRGVWIDTIAHVATYLRGTGGRDPRHP